MRKSVKIICIALCAAVLLGLGLYFIPWSTHVDQEMYGVIVTEDRQVVNHTQLKLTGVKKEYLSKKAVYKSSIKLEGPSINSNTYRDFTLSPPIVQDPAYPYISGSYNTFSTKINGFITGGYELSSDLDELILVNFDSNGQYLVASTDPNFDPLEILEAYLEITNH